MNVDLRLARLRVAVVKLTNRCNIRCKYCYESIVNRGTDMSSETFLDLSERIFASTSESGVLIVFHGGEPTLLDADWFETNLARVHELATKHQKRVRVSIQSNLIDISDDKLQVFRRHNVSLGGSLDNPKFLTETLRPLATKAVATYQRAQELGLRVGLLATINPSNIAAMPAFCEWLSSDLHVRHFKANIAYAVGAGINLTLPTAEAFFKAQRDIVEFMLETDGALIEDNLAREIVRFFENHHAGVPRAGTLCDDRRCGAGSKVIGVTPDGTLLPCGRFAWNDAHYYLGNMEVAADGNPSFFESVNRFFELEPQNWQHCDNCAAREICNFGCQAFIVRSKVKLNVECEPTQRRFAYYSANKSRLQKLYAKICAYEGRQPMSPFSQKLTKLLSISPEGQRAALLDRLVSVAETATGASPVT